MVGLIIRLTFMANLNSVYTKIIKLRRRCNSISFVKLVSGINFLDLNPLRPATLAAATLK